jgi:hypothetical protein
MRFNNIRTASVRVQAWWRGVHARKFFLTTRRSQIMVSAHYRGFKARQMFVQMREEKRLAEETKRELERQKEEDRLCKRAVEREMYKRDEAKRQEEIKRLEEEVRCRQAHHAQQT